MKKRGFSIAEVMIVITIIGLLAAIAIPSFQKAQKEDRMRKMGVSTTKAEKEEVTPLHLIRLLEKQSLNDDPNSPVISVYYIAEEQYIVLSTSNSATLTKVGN